MKGLIKTISAAAVVLAVTLTAGAVPGRKDAGEAFLRQIRERDSVLIADQLVYGFRIDGLPEGAGLSLPDCSKMFPDSIMVLSDWRLDTLKVRKKQGTADISGSVVITSFEEGEYRLPDLAVVRELPGGDSDTLVFKGATLDVRTMPVDTATFVPHDIKGQIRYPLTFAEILPYLAALHLAALIAVLVWAVISVRRKKRTGATGTAQEPPYIVALRGLDKFRGNRYWAPDKQKFFYSGVTDVLREYISSRFGVGAMEMTTAEIFDGLKDKDIEPALRDEALELFRTSDLVKFAKMTVSDEENMKAVPAAVRFVTATWKTEEEKEEGNVL